MHCGVGRRVVAAARDFGKTLKLPVKRVVHAMMVRGGQFSFELPEIELATSALF
jgi:hypothetical protein